MHALYALYALFNVVKYLNAILIIIAVTLLVSLSELASAPCFRLKGVSKFIENYQCAYVYMYFFTYNIKH